MNNLEDYVIYKGTCKPCTVTTSYEVPDGKGGEGEPIVIKVGKPSEEHG